MITEQIKARTAESHKAAERTDFMKNLFSGDLPIESYIKYLSVLMYIYDTLEATIKDNLDDDLVASIFDEKLERSWQISSDLGNLDKVVAFNGKLTDYINEYMIMIGEASPVELVAHHYIRYLGDLSGGQMLKGMLKQNYGLSDNQLSFYEFDLDAKTYREAYKEKLNSLIKKEADVNLFIDTVNKIYGVTTKILNSI